MGKRLGIAGTALSLVYLIGLTWLLAGRWGALHSLPLNELGDFLAGAFGPLAILWLVLGFFQQGIELRQNSAALHLQAQELANSVQQQKELVDVAKKQYESDRAVMEHQLRKFEEEREQQRQNALPRFAILSGGTHSDLLSEHAFVISNHGATCTEVRMHLEDQEIAFEPKKYSVLRNDERVKFVFHLPNIPPFEAAKVKITFIDASNTAGEFSYRLSLLKQNNHFNALLEAV
jgi:hypothetical protein